MKDYFGTEISVGDIVVQDCRRMRSTLRVVVGSASADTAILGNRVRINRDGSIEPMPHGNTKVKLCMLAKYHRQLKDS